MAINTKPISKMTGEELTVFLIDEFTPGVKKHAAMLAVPKEEVDALTADTDWLKYSQDTVLFHDDSRSLAVAFRNLLIDGNSGAETQIPSSDVAPKPPEQAIKPGIRSRTAALIQRIKRAAKYNESIGKELGIEWKNTGKDTGPEIKSIEQVIGGVKVRISKGGNSRRVCNVQCSYTGEIADFVDIGTAVTAEYVDKTPLPEGVKVQQRIYRYAFMDGNNPGENFCEPVYFAVSSVMPKSGSSNTASNGKTARSRAADTPTVVAAAEKAAKKA